MTGGAFMVAYNTQANTDVSNGEIMTTSEVAVFLKASVSAVRRWTRDGQLKGHRLGGKGDWRYFKRDVMAFITGEN
jgi:excisionase family DNA binding protein